MSFHAALNGKVLCGTFTGLNELAAAEFGFDIPPEYVGRIDPQRSVAFLMVEDDTPAGGAVFSYEITQFTSSRINFAASFAIEPADLVRVLIVS